MAGGDFCSYWAGAVMGRFDRLWRLGAVLAAVAWGPGAVLLAASPAAASVSSTPASGTPQLAPSGSTEIVRQLVQCGNTMYAVGQFTEISSHGTTYARNNAFSFSATPPYTVTSWNPNVNGVVNTIGFNGSNCGIAYLGGKFSSVNGTKVANIAAVDTTTGAVRTSFLHTANGQVETIVGADGHLLVGGYYTSINGSSADKYMTSLDPATGKDDGFIQLNISGNYNFCYGGSCAATNPTRVYNQQISNGGTLELVEGDFTSVGGQSRQQMFMLDLSGSTASVTNWTSPALDQNCWFSEPFYAQAAAWSPDDSTIYVGSTGYRPADGSWVPWSGSLCDAAAAFPATQTSVNPLWINYTGCDSLYSAAADADTAYFGGHERWSQNPDGCDYLGPGAISAPGMEGLSPTDGSLIFNPTRGRGLGADDMLRNTEGLWIASDNYQNANQCGGKWGHAGICLLPSGS
jgi:hypothetical protein